MGLTAIPKGSVFGKLEVLDYKVIRMSGKSRGHYLCKCVCGNEKYIRTDVLKKSKSCGICHRSKSSSTHGMSNTRLYNIYHHIKSRTNNPNDDSYDIYGGRGIRMCDEWLRDPNEFFKWSLENGYSDALTIDRIDNDGDYTPDNCRWATTDTQANNKRNSLLLEYKGRVQTVTQWASYFGVDPQNARYRYNRGWGFEDIFDLNREEIL